jgi:hypothetical protein
VVPPTERTCERCGRQETWNAGDTTWCIVEDDGEKRIGDPYCLHEWDINGTYNPLAE